MNSFMSPALMRRLAPGTLVLFSVVVAVAAYLQVLDSPFVSDDKFYIVNNSRLAELRLVELWRLLVEPYNSFSEFLPLRDFSYWLDISWFGQNPVAFRVHNLILYLLSVPLVYAVTANLWRRFKPLDIASAPWVAAAVTAMFALHPAMVESVVWISGRKYLLANLFAMLALWLAMKAKREQEFSTPYAVATLLAFVAMMLSKASYISVAPLIALFWLMLWLDAPIWRRHRSQLLWPGAILLLAVSLILIFIANSVGREPAYYGIEAVTRIFAVLGWLTRLAVSPETRLFVYPVFEDTFLPAMVALGVAVLAAGAVGALMAIRNRSLEGIALAAFLLLCLPYLQLIPYGPPSLVSDRWLAFAVWPASLLIVTLTWRLSPMLRALLLLVIALSWGVQTIQRSRDWRSTEAIVDADLRTVPGLCLPAMYKVNFQLSRGQLRDAHETAAGITTPECRDTMVAMADAYQVTATGTPQEAIPLLARLEMNLAQPPVQSKWNSPLNSVWMRARTALTDDWLYLVRKFPDDELLRYQLGTWLLRDHRYEEAVGYLRAATESQRLPISLRGEAYKNLGMALMNARHTAEAEAALLAALEQSLPDLQANCMLEAFYNQSARFEDAARARASCPGRSTDQKAMQ